MTDDKVIRVCMPVAGGLPVPGSVIRQCGTCGGSVWLDPLQRIPEGLSTELLCLTCAREDPETAAEIRRLEDNPAQARQEFEKAMRNRIGRTPE